jgi:hypothetical protein
VASRRREKTKPRGREARGIAWPDQKTEIPLATPLAAYIRVPLAWYHSTTHSYFEDETHTMIRRVYTHPTQEHSKRHFCGFCGTPLSYWSESPLSEADYINLTLGSLMQEDLADLEDMGLLPDDSTEEEEGEAGEEEEAAEVEEDSRAAGPASTTGSASLSTALRASYSVPWFEELVEGTRLGRLTRSHGIKRTQDGKVKIEWEVVEFNGDDEDEMENIAQGSSAATPAKRKRESAGATPRK